MENIPESISESARQVWQVIRGFNQAFADNDPEEYFKHIDDDIVVLTPGNPYRIEGLPADREEFEFGLQQGYSRVGYFQELQPQIRVFGDVAIVTYYSRGSYGPAGEAKTLYLKETDVLVRREEGWKLIHIHVSAPGG